MTQATPSQEIHTKKTTVHPLLIELLTEELPPKALPKLETAFANGLHQILKKHHLLSDDSQVKRFSTPRRLAVLITQVLEQAPKQPFSERLMPVSIGLNDDGSASAALLKKLEAIDQSHVAVNELTRKQDGKHEFLFLEGSAEGAKLEDALQEALDYAITHLPIPKVMQYQLADGSSVKFVRPAHRLTAVWGNTVVPVTALGLAAGRTIEGHRFMGEKTMQLEHAEHYEDLLFERGKVVASFDARKAAIQQALETQAKALNTTLGDSPEVAALLNEVTALVENPSVYVGEFEPSFLDVPAECLILTMRQNQRYFPLFDPESGKLTHRFLIVSNMQPADPSNIIEGNERVVRPRLADAKFFFETDRQQKLQERTAALADSVYHNKLGSQLERSERIAKIAVHIAEQLGANTAHAERAAKLAKADLNTLMVSEFPELQGIIGAYYAQADGEDPAVVEALRSQYQLRLSQATTESTLVATCLFMAERLETLVGIWGIGLPPTGERDPFGLRRAALGLISAWQQLQTGGWLNVPEPKKLALKPLLNFVASTFAADTIAEGTVDAVANFIYERFRNQLATEYEHAVIDAVLALQPAIHEIPARINACRRFAQSPEAASLAAANKRIDNLLKRADQSLDAPNPSLFTEAAEQQLYDTINQLQPQANAQYQAGDFTGSLATLAEVHSVVDSFFDNVMIMADDENIRNNRLALLQQLYQAMNQVAELARLD